MDYRTLGALLVLLPFVANARADNVYRWVDGAGRVHYGDSVPDAMKEKAQPVDVSGGRVQDEDRVAAQNRAARDKSLLDRLRNWREDAQPPQVATITGTRPSASSSVKLTCAQEWERFNRSGACFDPYRTRRGVRGEAFERCTSIPMPTCINPQQPSSERTHAAAGSSGR